MLVPVKSSNIAAIGYNPATLTLDVQFTPDRTGCAAVWQYDNVSHTEYTELLSAPSIGRAFSRYIKTTHAGRKIATLVPELPNYEAIL